MEVKHRDEHVAALKKRFRNRWAALVVGFLLLFTGPISALHGASPGPMLPVNHAAEVTHGVIGHCPEAMDPAHAVCETIPGVLSTSWAGSLLGRERGPGDAFRSTAHLAFGRSIPPDLPPPKRA